MLRLVCSLFLVTSELAIERQSFIISILFECCFSSLLTVLLWAPSEADLEARIGIHTDYLKGQSQMGLLDLANKHAVTQVNLKFK